MNALLNFAFGHSTSGRFVTGRAAWGLLALRLVMGLAFVLHGYPKIQHPFSWMPGSSMPGILLAAAALAEFGGGLALIVGFLTPLAALGQLATMTIALTTVLLPAHMPLVGDPGKPSYEIALVYFAASLLFLLVGPGSFSVDALLFGERKSSFASSSAASGSVVASTR